VKAVSTIRAGLLAAAALLTTGAASGGWNQTVAETASGTHVLGNPAAKVKLTTFVSYTCPHCAQFETEAEAPLRLSYVAPGKLSIEVRHVVRDPVDLTAAMLTNCGAKEKFFLNHAAFMRGQSRWIAPMGAASAAQQQRWRNPDIGQRNRAIASDFGFYAIMASRGYDRTSVDKCLTDKAMEARLMKQSQEAVALGVRSTPGFAINGTVLVGTNEWALLRPQLDARF
jgi:protein-disulfide isomerase